MHRDARNFFPHPEGFWPERWLLAGTGGSLGAKIVHNPGAFIPFSFGPSNCAGKGLALQEMRMVICVIMQRLELKFARDYNPESYLEGLRDFFVTKKPPLLVDVVKIRNKVFA